MYKNQDKYRFFREQGITVERYRYFSKEQKDAWKWAADNEAEFKLSREITNDLVQYRSYVERINGIEADKDGDGKSVSGSRKKKVIAYIRNLDLSDEAKMILLKSEYTSDDSYNREIINYINDLEELTYSDKKTILEKLGFKVGADGRITW